MMWVTNHVLGCYSSLQRIFAIPCIRLARTGASFGCSLELCTESFHVVLVTVCFFKNVVHIVGTIFLVHQYPSIATKRSAEVI